MRTRFWTSVASLCLLGMVLAPQSLGQTQPDPARLDAIQARLNQMAAAYDQLPPNHKALLDGPSNAIAVARAFGKLRAQASAGRPLTRRPFSPGTGGASPDLAVVNDNSTDLDFSGFDGVTQSETSTAMCGSQVVVGFNDSGSVLQTAFFGSGGLSFSGAAVSSDRGLTFHDIGPTPAGADVNNFVIGDPVVTCSSPSTFYYTQLFAQGSFFAPQSAIAISKSGDGGNTWGDPVAAVSKPESRFLFRGHFLDKPWSAIDPSNPNRIYITYTDFDDSGTSAGCGKQPRTAIELVASNDGAQSFGSPMIIDEVCGANLAVQASHVAVSSRGTVYVAWERFTATGAEVRITHFAPGGSPTPSVLINQKVFGGDTFLVFPLPLELETDLQGELRDLVGLDLAVDRSGGPSDGTVFVTWDDGRNKSVPDLLGIFPPPFTGMPSVEGFNPFVLTAGTYFYTDVLVSRSPDGQHFSPAMKVNSDSQPQVGGGHDHFQPAIAVDPSGRVAACWYDRRNDPANFAIERFCAQSPNGGQTWSNFRVPIAPFAPLHRLDFLVNPAYMGDYDGLTSDFTGSTRGFIGAFEWMSSGMNPDVRSYRFQ